MQLSIESSHVFDIMSYMELKSAVSIVGNVEEESILNVSREADRIGVPRSTAVNALKKLEIAGLISTRSLGSKGTLIKVLGEGLGAELSSLPL